MLERVAAHYVGINTGSERKYRIIWEAAHQLDYAIEFDVLYYAQQTNKEGNISIDDLIVLKELFDKLLCDKIDMSDLREISPTDYLKMLRNRSKE